MRQQKNVHAGKLCESEEKFAGEENWKMRLKVNFTLHTLVIDDVGGSLSHNCNLMLKKYFTNLHPIAKLVFEAGRRTCSHGKRSEPKVMTK